MSRRYRVHVSQANNGGEDPAPEGYDFGSYCEAVIAEDSLQELFVCSMSHFDLVVKVSFAVDIIRNEAVKIGK